MRALLEGLNPDGAVRRALDPEGWSWSQDAELLALVAELLDESNRLFLRAHLPKGKEVPPAIRIPRPGRDATATTKKGTSMDELRRMVRGENSVVVT